MEKQVIIVSLIVGFLGLLSVILGFTAEVTKINASDVYVGDFVCVYPSSPAFGAAIVAALFLLVAQIVVTVFSGCCGCCKKDPSVPAVTGTKRTVAIILVVISWITFGISMTLFIVGADKNGTGGQTNDTCLVVKPGVFASAAICALITVCLSIGAYIIFCPATDAATKHMTGVHYANGIAMGTPQFAPIQPQYAAPSNGGYQHPPPGTGGSQYPAPGNGGYQHPPPGTGGSQYPAPGNGGDQYPPPGTGGSQYPPPGTKNSF